MNDDDPFFGGGGSDRTVIKPIPGGRGAQSAPRGPSQSSYPPNPEPYLQQQTSAPRQAAYVPPANIGAIVGSGLNPLINAATTLLALVGQLRNSVSHPNAEGLRAHVVRQMTQFEESARSQGATPEAVLAARYALCTLLDETVLNTPWGSESAWSKQSLLSTFHNETWGGEKFFTILDRMMQEPGRNLWNLELMFVCLSLGLEGKYRVVAQGGASLVRLQDELMRTIRTHRGDFERELSAHWRGVEDKRNLLVRYVPLWVVAALSGALLLAMYTGFHFILGSSADPVYQALQSVATQTPKQIQE